MTQTIATVEEVQATVAQTAEHAQNVAEAAQQSLKTSASGQDSVEDTIQGMHTIQTQVEAIAENILALSERTQQIGDIIETVNDIADQSKLLALNATIEAARAGEEGRGFAVVAMEIRQLAEQSRQATARIRTILEEIQQATNTAVMVTEEGNKSAASGMALVDRTGHAIGILADTIETAAQAATQIAASTGQQNTGMRQLLNAMAAIKQAAAQTVTSTRQAEVSARASPTWRARWKKSWRCTISRPPEGRPRCKHHGRPGRLSPPLTNIPRPDDIRRCPARVPRNTNISAY